MGDLQETIQPRSGSLDDSDSYTKKSCPSSVVYTLSNPGLGRASWGCANHLMNGLHASLHSLHLVDPTRSYAAQRRQLYCTCHRMQLQSHTLWEMTSHSILYLGASSTVTQRSGLLAYRTVPGIWLTTGSKCTYQLSNTTWPGNWLNCKAYSLQSNIPGRGYIFLVTRAGQLCDMSVKQWADMWAPWFGQCLTLLTHLLLLDIILFVVNHRYSYHWSHISIPVWSWQSTEHIHSAPPAKFTAIVWHATDTWAPAWTWQASTQFTWRRETHPSPCVLLPPSEEDCLELKSINFSFPRQVRLLP